MKVLARTCGSGQALEDKVMNALKMLGVAGLALSLAGCVPNWARENETGLLMTVADVTGIEGGEGGSGQEGAVLFSDVSSLFNDDARVTVQLFRKNPDVSFTGPLEAVRLESYQVRYLRSDGRNVEGLDVPNRVTGSLNSVVIPSPSGSDVNEVDLVVNIVRHQAKLESPLRNLVGVFLSPTRSIIFASEGVITTSAEITIFGRQVTTGEVLRATGRLQVTFADFADEE
jgi:hypothetical protein